MHTSRSIRSQAATNAGGWNSASMSKTRAPSEADVGNAKRRRINWNDGRVTPGARSVQEIRMRRGRRSELTESSRTGEPSLYRVKHDPPRIIRHRYFVPLEIQPARVGKPRRNGAELWSAEAERPRKVRNVDRADALHALDGFVDLADVQHVLKPSVLEAHELLDRRLGRFLHLRLEDVRFDFELASYNDNRIKRVAHFHDAREHPLCFEVAQDVLLERFRWEVANGRRYEQLDAVPARRPGAGLPQI